MEEAVKALVSDESDDGYAHHHTQAPQAPPLSRLSVCSSSFTCGNDEDEDEDDGFYGDMETYMSRLSIESFDADEELSDEQKTLLTSDSEGERVCYSLPATPPRRRKNRGLKLPAAAAKGYASENEAGAAREAERPRKSGARRRTAAGSLGPRRDDGYWNGVSGESEGGVGVKVITRPKGGRRSLCMDLEEVKACRDLGFELEKLSVSGSNLDTNSSGGNSPIANWRISSPGDDPKDVKARLKVWAQAVALVSASQSTQHSN